jgi:hypothetical protein
MQRSGGGNLVPMKRFALLLASLCAPPLCAQITYPATFFAGSPPGGIGAACAVTTYGYLTAAGQVVTCVSNIWTVATGGGGGTLTNFTAGALSPLFTTLVATSTTTPALTFALSNFAADAILGNFSGSSAAPSTQAIPACANDGAHALVYVSHVLTCESVTAGGASAALGLLDFAVTVPSNVLTFTLPATGANPQGVNFNCGGVIQNAAAGLVVTLATPTAASAANAYIYWDCANQRFGVDTATGLTGLTLSNVTLGSTGVTGFPGNGFVPFALATAGATANTWGAASTVVDELGVYSAQKLAPGTNVTIPCDTHGTCTVNATGGTAIPDAFAANQGHWSPFGLVVGPTTTMTANTLYGSELPPSPLATITQIMIVGTFAGNWEVTIWNAAGTTALANTTVVVPSGGTFSVLTFPAFQFQINTTYLVTYTTSNNGDVFFSNNDNSNFAAPAGLTPRVFTCANSASWSGTNPNLPSICGTRTVLSSVGPFLLSFYH